MIIEATAPTRIDLAGGAFDVYPLYVFEDGGVTVNIAVNLITKVRIETREDKEIHLTSVDLGVEEVAEDIEALKTSGELELVARLVKFYAPKTGVNVTTENTIPKGSGLGASSSLLIALSGALNELNQTNFSPQELIDYGALIEASSLKVTTGKQDYFAAMYGGINAVWSEIKGCWTEPIRLDEQVMEELNERIILTYTGRPRFSGAINWDLVKGYIDDVGSTRENLRRVKETGLAMRECLIRADLDRFAELLKEEWENRKRTAEGVTNERIDKLMADAVAAGALAAKLCGAGGGGCMITYVRREDRAKVIKALEAGGAKYMDWQIARKGLTITRPEGN